MRATASGIGRHEPPLATIASRLQPAPMATTAMPGIRQLRSTATRTAQVGRDIERPARPRRPSTRPAARRARPGRRARRWPATPSGTADRPADPSRPPSEVAGDDPDRDGVEDEHRGSASVGLATGSGWLAPAGRRGPRRWPMTKRSGIAATGHLADRAGAGPPCAGRPGVRVGQRPPDAPRPASIRSNSRAGGSVRSRSIMPSRSASSAMRPNGTGSRRRRPRRDALHSPSQNGSISATWARTSGGPHDASGPRVEVARRAATAHPPSTAARVAARRRAGRRSGRGRSRGRRSSWSAVSHGGVAWRHCQRLGPVPPSRPPAGIRASTAAEMRT